MSYRETLANVSPELLDKHGEFPPNKYWEQLAGVSSEELLEQKWQEFGPTSYWGTNGGHFAPRVTGGKSWSFVSGVTGGKMT